jgi:diaminopimelate epimerase
MIPKRFIKYHGLGNDFPVFFGGMSGCRSFSPERVAELCHRGKGIGADGVMLARPSEVADVRMELINSDGSTPEMCGNGLRCFVKFAVEELGIRSNPLAVETNGGVRLCFWSGVSADVVNDVKVDMGRPSFERGVIPMTGKGSSQDVAIDSDGHAFVVQGVNTGNPHMVIFGDASLARARTHGPTLTDHPMWPLGTNVEFAEVLGPQVVKLTVWERGCGLTQACGTGATATVVAAIRLGLCAFDTSVTVRLPGGDLQITVEADFRTAWMEGPVALAYRGETEEATGA